MPVVFVHGVRTRRDEGYERARQQREALFRREMLDGVSADPAGTQVLEPYWGDLAARFAWDLASVPSASDHLESLSSEEDEGLVALGAALAAAAPVGIGRDQLLLAVARSNGLGEVVDLAVAGTAQGTATGPAELADFGARAARYAQAHPKPGWLDEVHDDDALLDRLATEVDALVLDGGTAADSPEWESLGGLGILDALREGADRLKQIAVPLVGKPAYNVLRRLLVPTIATFVGDVFVYQTRRGTPDAPGPIPVVVLKDLDQAAALRTPEDPLIVIGHSMGGVIAYDLLTSFRTELPVDALITVGSQVGLFEELKLFVASQTDVPGAGGATLPLPAGVATWINVLDYNDVLSYRVAPIVSGVAEFAYATAELFAAHGAYFSQPRLHERLRARLRAAGVGTG